VDRVESPAVAQFTRGGGHALRLCKTMAVVAGVPPANRSSLQPTQLPLQENFDPDFVISVTSARHAVVSTKGVVKN
jgi:hypothetical protein